MSKLILGRRARAGRFFVAIITVLLGAWVGPVAYGAPPANPWIAGNARFTVITPGLVRLEYQPDGRFIDERTMLATERGARSAEFRVETDSTGGIRILTSRLELTYRPDGHPFHAGNLTARIFRTEGERAQDSIAWTFGARNLRNLGGTITSLDQINHAVDLGEGLISRDGWYWLDDSGTPLRTKGWVRARPRAAGASPGSVTDGYLFAYGQDYKSALRSLAAIGGAVPLPRRYVLGSWYSRWWPYSSQDYRAIVAEYAVHDFPLDGMVMDMDWHLDGWTGYTWNRKLLPDAEDLLRWFHTQGLRVTLNDHPALGVGPQEAHYAEFMRDMRHDPSTGEVIPFDAANRDYMLPFFRDTHVPLQAEGVDFWWLDWQQTVATLGLPSLRNLPWLNDFYYHQSEHDGLRGQSFSRWGGWGDHRYPIHFSGDAYTNWETLAFEVPFTATAGNVGCFFWSHDIGGHMGGRNEESYVRWTQFGALSTALRVHSTRSPDMDRRPWTYSPAAQDAIRRSFHLRSELFPYIYTSVEQAHRETLPLVRPLYLEHPEREESYRNPQEYLFGDSLLVAPITSAGQGADRIASQRVWFPPGGAWYDWFTGVPYAPETAVRVTAGLNEFPLFARGGVPIPLQPYTPRMTSEALRTLVVRAFPGEQGVPGTGTLYEDDGETREFAAGAAARTALTYLREGSRVTVTVAATQGSYRGQPGRRALVVELPAMPKASAAFVNGRPAAIEYEAERRLNRVRVAEGDTREAREVRLEFP